MDRGSEHDDEHKVPFECNICYEMCREPVVTTCGHLFCWMCIYQWIHMNRSTLICPTCKNGITVNRLIPIYTKGKHDDETKEREGLNIPERPMQTRFAP